MGQYYGCEEQTPLTPVYDNIDLRKEEITPEDKSLHTGTYEAYVAVDFEITNANGQFSHQRSILLAFYANPSAPLYFFGVLYGGDSSTAIRDHIIGFVQRMTEFPLLIYHTWSTMSSGLLDLL